MQRASEKARGKCRVHGAREVERKEDRLIVLDHWIGFMSVSHVSFVMSQRARRATTRDCEAAAEPNGVR